MRPVTVRTAAVAPEKWLEVREDYFSHIFTCSSCKPRGNVFCQVGLKLKDLYEVEFQNWRTDWEKEHGSRN